MQEDLKSIIRFDDFAAYFGPKGVVAMAWWMGAVHADRIREDHGSFPFLQVVGDAGIGKTRLLNYLQTLTGQIPYAYGLGQTTIAARVRTAASLGNQVVIYEKEDDERHLFDWDELKPLFSQGCPEFAAKDGWTEPYTFKGALAITARQPLRCSEAVRSRMVTVNFSDDDSHSTRIRPDSLRWVGACAASAFGARVGQLEEWIAGNLHSLVPDYKGQLLHEFAERLSPRIALNCAQLLALVDMLETFVPISPTLRVEVQREIRQMAAQSAEAYPLAQPRTNNVASRIAALMEKEERERPPIRAAGIAALGRLIPVAQRTSGQSRIVGGFLLSLYNGSAFPFPLTDLRGLDTALYDDCIALLNMDRHPEKEVHEYVKNGDAIWSKFKKDWAARQQ